MELSNTHIYLNEADWPVPSTSCPQGIPRLGHCHTEVSTATGRLCTLRAKRGNTGEWFPVWGHAWTPWWGGKWGRFGSGRSMHFLRRIQSQGVFRDTIYKAISELSLPDPDNFEANVGKNANLNMCT